MVGVKDVHDVAGINTYHGSHAFAGAPTAPSSSPLVQGLEDAGVIVLGKTSTSELEFSATSENPVSGISQHPTHPAHTPGGSSGGSAIRSEEHTSELQSLMRISYAVFCLKKKKTSNEMTEH